MAGCQDTRAARQAGAYLVTRVTNGALGVLHAAVVISILGEAQAGRFLVFWTAAWLLSVVVRAGVDSVMPRFVAEARRGSERMPSLRPLMPWAISVALCGSPVALAALGIPVEPATVAIAVAIAGCWSATFVLGGLLKAHGRAGLSGLVTNVVWASGTAIAPLGLLAVQDSWRSLALLTSGASLVAAAVALAITVRALGAEPVRELIAPRRARSIADLDVAGAGVQSVLVEVLTWLPMILAATFAPPSAAAVTFAATRLAGPFSWAYQSVVVVSSPRIAAALAARDTTRAAWLLRRAALGGAMTTVPLAALGILIAPRLVEALLGRPSATGTTILVALIAARALDAATGPLSEALVVGRRTWVDAGLLAAGILLGFGLAGILSGPLGAVAVGMGAGGAFVAANVARLMVVPPLLRRGWPAQLHIPRRAARPTPLAAAAVCALGAGLALGAWIAPFAGSTRLALAVVAAPLAAAGLGFLAAGRHGARAAALSPLAFVVLLLVAHFALRPLALFVEPRSATAGLYNLGFGWSDLADAASLGTLGTLALGLGFIAPRPSLDPNAGARTAAGLRPRMPSTKRITVGLALALAVGTGLWGALFLRLGGPTTLADNPAALHLNQFGGLYGVFGMLLCLGATLVALWAWLQRPERQLAMLVVAAALVSAIAAVCLATRGPLIATAFGAALLVLRDRRVTRGRLAAVAAIGTLLFVAVAGAREVRHYAQYEPASDAVAHALEGFPLSTLTGDLIEFDHLVALRRVVPEALPWLDGRSLRDVPSAFVPRAVWSDKPVPIDYELAQVLYGSETVAGTPPTLAGEMYWNFGSTGAVMLLLVLGLVGGAIWWQSARGTGTRDLLLAVGFGYSYLLLTRPLASMALLAVTAGVAVATATVASGVAGAGWGAAEVLRHLRAGRRIAGPRTRVASYLRIARAR